VAALDSSRQGCGEWLRLQSASFHCQLERYHEGPCVASGHQERITDQVMMDEGRLYVQEHYTVSWLASKRSTKEVGKDSPEWRQALRRDRE
jgi:hypothetical protein